MTNQTVLEQAIITYNDAYRRGNALISDAEYDALLDKLKTNFPSSDLLKKGVLDEVKGSRKQKLPIPMYSLNKVKSVEELLKWAASKGLSEYDTMIFTPKFDGISLVVNEQTKECWTRGDGEEGQNSTKHHRQMRGYDPDEHPCYSFGEAIISKSTWDLHFKGCVNPETGKVYTNARNTVAGWFNSGKLNDNLKYVNYMRYGSDMTLDKDHQIRLLNQYNLQKVNNYACKLKQIDAELLEYLYNKWSEDFQIDGLVLDVVDYVKRNDLGRELDMNPAFAVAFKNPAWSSAAEVKVLGIEWKVSKQGKLKPVINIEPTEVAGVTISNVTGYNAKYVFDNNINTGSIIRIVRSGDVIPKHILTLSFNEDDMNCLADAMVECPCCGMQTKWDESMTELVCTNEDCREMRLGKLSHFFNTMEIEEFGEPSIIKFYDAGYDTIYKILKITDDQIIDIEGFGMRSAYILFAQFEKLRLKGVPAAKLIHSLDVMDGKIGEKTIQSILDNLDHSKLANYNFISVYDLTSIDGVADITAEVFLKGFAAFIHTFPEDLVKITYVKSPKKEVVGDKFKGQKICFTGCRPSKEQQDEIESQGGEIVSGVSSKTTMLVVKDYSEKTMKSNKALTAQKLNVQIIRIEEL